MATCTTSGPAQDNSSHASSSIGISAASASQQQRRRSGLRNIRSQQHAQHAAPFTLSPANHLSHRQAPSKPCSALSMASDTQASYNMQAITNHLSYRQTPSCSTILIDKRHTGKLQQATIQTLTLRTCARAARHELHQRAVRILWPCVQPRHLCCRGVLAAGNVLHQHVHEA